MCGGNVIRVPCSRVAHLFREKGWKQTEKAFDGDRDLRIRATLHNNKRISEIWMSQKYLDVFLAKNEEYMISKIKTDDKESLIILKNVSNAGFEPMPVEC